MLSTQHIEIHQRRKKMAFDKNSNFAKQIIRFLKVGQWILLRDDR